MSQVYGVICKRESKIPDFMKMVILLFEYLFGFRVILR